MRLARCLLSSMLLLVPPLTPLGEAGAFERVEDYELKQIRGGSARAARPKSPVHDGLMDGLAQDHWRAKRLGRGSSSKPPKGQAELTDSLTEPATPASFKRLQPFGLPFIEGIPPIAILFPPQRKAP